MPPLDHHVRVPRLGRTPLSSAITTVCLQFLVAASATRILPAQSVKLPPVRLESFAARNERASSTVFGGLSLAGYSGGLGLRVTGAVSGLDFGGDRRYTTGPVQSCSRSGCRTVIGRRYTGGDLFSVNAWTADADVIAEPFRQVPVLRQLLLGFSPYAFVGIGRFDANSSGGVASDSSLGVWSYGLGAHHDLIGRVGITAEARARRSLDDNAFIGGTFRNAVQYRLGVNVGLGGGARREPPRPTIVSRRILPPTASEPARVPAARVPSPSASPSTPADAAADAAIAERAAATIVPRLLDAAESLVDVRWREGGVTPAQGFDAGGFVQYVFAQENIALPRLVRDLATTGSGVSVRIGSLRAGDLLLFSNDGVTADHVGIFVGHDRFVHASASGNGVRYDTLGEDARGAWFASHLIGARRVVGVSGIDARPITPIRVPSGRPDGAPRPAGAP